jgi:hypothetical protein
MDADVKGWGLTPIGHLDPKIAFPLPKREVKDREGRCKRIIFGGLPGYTKTRLSSIGSASRGFSGELGIRLGSAEDRELLESRIGE